MIPTHRRLLLPQAVDHDRVVKTLQLRQGISKSNYDKQSRDLPPLEVGDKVRIRPNRGQQWRKAEVLPRSYLLEDEQGRIYRRNRRQIISVPNDQSMHPQLHVAVAPQLDGSSTRSNLPETEEQSPSKEDAPVRTTVQAQNSPITTRSGRQVRNPERLTESC